MVIRKERDRRPWSLAIVMVMGCFERTDPPWLLDESIEILAVRAVVIQDGAEATTITPVPADRFRTDVLPGDTIRASLLAASQGGVAELEDIADARWFKCRDIDCVNELRNDTMLQPCGETLDAGAGCSLGAGHQAVFVPPAIDGAYPPGLGPVDVNVGVVLGTPSGPQSGECVGRMRQRPYPSLAGCSLFEHMVQGGPIWKISELAGIELDPTLVPEQVRFIPPNFAPEVERFDVFIRGDDGARELVVPTGERVSVSAGDRVRLGVQVDPRDLQRYVATYGDELVMTEEILQFTYYADVAVATSTEYWIEPQVSWTVPDDADSVFFVATLVDLRGGVGWGTIAFDVDGVAP